MNRTLSRVVLFALLAVPSSASNVLVVATSGAPYTTIQSAVDVAVDGDVVLVRASAVSYAPFAVVDKSVVVVGDGGGVSVDGPVTISGLALGRTSTLVQLRVQAPTNASPALHLSSCAGMVRIEGCLLFGEGLPEGTADGSDALRIDACDAVLVTGCQMRGGFGSEGDIFVVPPKVGGAGIRSTSSSVAIWESSAFGGLGETAVFQYDGGNGGDAIHCAGGDLFLSYVTALGGSGGAPNCCGYGGYGGDGIDTASTLRLIDVTRSGGSGSYFGSCGPCEGMGGSGGSHGSSLLGPGQTTSWPVPAKRMSSTRVVREGGTITLDLRGAIGDIVGLVTSTAPDHTLVEAQFGVRASSISPTVPHRITRLGTIASNPLTRSFVQGPLAPGESAKVQYLQPLVSTSGSLHLGTPATLIVLDAAF